MWSIGKVINYRTLFKVCARRVSLNLLAGSTVIVAVQCTSALESTAGTVQVKLLSGGASFSLSDNNEEADVFVFADDARARLDTYQRVAIRNGMVSAVSTSGEKIVAVVVNSGRERHDWSRVDSWKALQDECFSIMEDDPDHPMMSGFVHVPASSDRQCGIELQPMLSKVVLRSLSCDFAGRPYEGEKLSDVKIYLTNVSASCGIMDDSVSHVIESLNRLGLNLNDMARLKSPNLMFAELSSSVGTQTVSPGVALYCYPNCCPEESLGSRFTRLVIEGKLRGETYYWPIDINRSGTGPVYGCEGVERNRSYIFDICLTRLGSSNPDIPVSAGNFMYFCLVIPWNETEGLIERF